jgi:antitoxin component YwqK of YwqJK toxin-antitoxin module
MKIAAILLVLGFAGLLANTLLGKTAVTPETARTTYYANGNLESRAECIDGKREGTCERWHANGTKMAEGRYENGRMEGEWNFWNADGTPDVDRSGTYRLGEKVKG